MQLRLHSQRPTVPVYLRQVGFEFLGDTLSWLGERGSWQGLQATGGWLRCEGRKGFPRDARVFQGYHVHIILTSPRLDDLTAGGKNARSSPAEAVTPSCAELVSELSSWSGNFIRRLQNFSLDWRLGNLATTGKIAARNAVTQALRVSSEVHQGCLWLPGCAWNEVSEACPTKIAKLSC